MPIFVFVSEDGLQFPFSQRRVRQGLELRRTKSRNSLLEFSTHCFKKWRPFNSVWFNADYTTADDDDDDDDDDKNRANQYNVAAFFRGCR